MAIAYIVRTWPVDFGHSENIERYLHMQVIDSLIRLWHETLHFEIAMSTTLLNYFMKCSNRHLIMSNSQSNSIWEYTNALQWLVA